MKERYPLVISGKTYHVFGEGNMSRIPSVVAYFQLLQTGQISSWAVLQGELSRFATDPEGFSACVGPIQMLHLCDVRGQEESSGSFYQLARMAGMILRLSGKDNVHI
jgi:hypothetical protein